MLNLIDGPCKGTYYVQRAPLFLRAVLRDDGEKDVLDQLEDTPATNEAVFVYKLYGDPGRIHIYGKTIRGYFATGEYRHLTEVDGENLRDTNTWREWASNEL